MTKFEIYSMKLVEISIYVLIAIAVILVVILLISLFLNILDFFSSKDITEGSVVNKEFSPAHSETVTIPRIISNGKTCSTVIVPYVYHYSDTYKITIRDYIDNEEQTATYRVTKEVYDSVNIGDEFIYNKEYEPNEPEYTREKQEKEQNIYE